jgi:hypothetical protein
MSMDKAILLAAAASLCTATASVCQRKGAVSAGTGPAGFDIWLVLRLARHPVWLLGIACMICGFGFQVSALRFGPLALVQPILALELLFVFGFLAVAGRRYVRVRRREWLAACAMTAGIGLFLGVAAPSGGRLHAPLGSWLLAGTAMAVVVLAAVAAAYGMGGHRSHASRSRRAALLGAATGVSWGFVAAIIKELSSHLGGGFGAVFSTWSPYALVVVGAGTMILASHALAAGPLAASQPGFTILDPLSASLLGEFLFAERLRTTPVDLVFEGAALAVVVAGAAGLSHSGLIRDESMPQVPARDQTRAARRGEPEIQAACAWPAASSATAGIVPAALTLAAGEIRDLASPGPAVPAGQDCPLQAAKPGEFRLERRAGDRTAQEG